MGLPEELSEDGGPLPVAPQHAPPVQQRHHVRLQLVHRTENTVHCTPNRYEII